MVAQQKMKNIVKQQATTTSTPTKSHRQWNRSTIAFSSAVFVATNIHSKFSDLIILAWFSFRHLSYKFEINLSPQ